MSLPTRCRFDECGWSVNRPATEAAHPGTGPGVGVAHAGLQCQRPWFMIVML
jgi:hypothetical protein